MVGLAREISLVVTCATPTGDIYHGFTVPTRPGVTPGRLHTIESHPDEIAPNRIDGGPQSVNYWEVLNEL